MSAAESFDTVTDLAVTAARRRGDGRWATRILCSIAALSGLAATAMVVWGVAIVLAP